MCIYSAFVTFVIVVVRVCRTSFDCFIKISAVQVLFQYVYILTSAGTIGYYNKCTCNVIILNPLCVKFIRNLLNVQFLSTLSGLE